MAPIQKLSLLAALFTLSLQISAQGTQFITGPCANDAACTSECCGFKSGKCAGAIIALERDGGCGFGDATPNDRAARLLRGELPAPVQSNKTSSNPVARASTLKILASYLVEPIKARVVALVNGTEPYVSGVNGTTPDVAPPVNVTEPVNSTVPDVSPPVNVTQPVDATIPDVAPPVNVTEPVDVVPSLPEGTQFITGVCTSDASCASRCCGFNSGKCAGPIVAQERDGGCGFGNGVPNNNAARALKGRRVVRRAGRGRAVVL